MAILAVVFMLTVGMPILIWMLQGAFAILEAIFYVLEVTVCALWRLYVRRRNVRQATTAAPRKPSTTRSTTTKPRKPVDPTKQKRQNVAAGWEAMGHEVGVINLTTGEVYQPAPRSDGKE